MVLDKGQTQTQYKLFLLLKRAQVSCFVCSAVKPVAQVLQSNKNTHVTDVL